MWSRRVARTLPVQGVIALCVAGILYSMRAHTHQHRLVDQSESHALLTMQQSFKEVPPQVKPVTVPLTAPTSASSTVTTEPAKGHISANKTAKHAATSVTACSAECPDWTYQRENDTVTRCWLPKPRVKKHGKLGAIAILARAQDIGDLLTTVPLLNRNFNHKFQYPLFIFHDDDFPTEDKQRIRRASAPTLISFERISFCVPLHIRERERTVKTYKVPKLITGRPVSYRHMIRFFFFKLLEHPAMQSYKFYWRLDAHSEVMSKIDDVDIFKYMNENDKKYGFVMINDNPGHEGTTAGIEESTQSYMKDRGVRPKTPLFYDNFCSTTRHGGRSFHFWNNFEIVDLDWLGSDRLKDYADYMDKVGGIYSKRWGDANLRTYETCAFLNIKQVEYFGDLIGYRHVDRISCPALPPLGRGCTDGVVVHKRDKRGTGPMDWHLAVHNPCPNYCFHICNKTSCAACYDAAAKRGWMTIGGYSGIADYCNASRWVSRREHPAVFKPIVT